MHVGNRSLLEQVLQALFALPERLLHAQPVELRRRARAEDLEDRQPAGLGRHGRFIQHAQVAEHRAIARRQWHPKIPLDARLGVRVLQLHAAGDMTQPATDYAFAGRAGQVVLDIFDDPAVGPERQCADFLRRLEFGDERVRHAHGQGQVPHQGAEEIVADAACRALDNRAQRGQLVVGS